jgi:hypothetical protein
MDETIFIYGYLGYKKQERIAKKIFGNKNLICFEYNSSLKQSIEDISYELNQFVKSLKIKSNKKVNLIGISAGGVIAEYYSKFINPKIVDKIATICSPLNGTYLANFYPKKFKGLNQLKRNSILLRKLKYKKLGKNKIINFYSYLDLLVPGNSGKGENPVHTWNFLHFIIQNDKSIFKRIKYFFNKT